MCCPFVQLCMQGRPKATPRRPKRLPRVPKTVTSVPQDAPRALLRTQDAPMALQEHPKSAQDTQRAPWIGPRVPHCEALPDKSTTKSHTKSGRNQWREQLSKGHRSNNHNTTYIIQNKSVAFGHGCSLVYIYIYIYMYICIYIYIYINGHWKANQANKNQKYTTAPLRG